jgi:hypothetical protein
MADVQLWEGGNAVVVGVDCGGCKENVYPAPHRMAAHRRRAPYIMGGAIDPVCDVRNRDCYCQLVTDDIVWLALVPEDSFVEYIRLKIPDGDANGLLVTVVAERINADDGVLIGAVALPAAFAAVATVAPIAVFGAPTVAPAYTNPFGVGGVREAIRVGIQVTAVPVGGFCLYQGRIELSVYARDLETVQIADCRINGSCVINNP